MQRLVSSFTLLFSLFVLGACGTTQNPAPFKHYGQVKPGDAIGTHTVREGDTVWGIAARYETSVKSLIARNDIKAPYKLAVGDRLHLPPPNNYTVRSGDTLHNISRTFNVGVSQLAQVNSLQAPYILKQGQEIRIPFGYSLADASKPEQKKPSYDVAKVEIKPRYSNRPDNDDRKRRSIITPLRKAAASSLLTYNPAKPPRRSGDKFRWPVRGQIVMPFGPQQGGLHNDGLNIKAPRGAPVKAAENGVVVYSGSALKGLGNLVLVKHDEDWVTAYAHLDRAVTRKGQIVRRGDPIGTVGQTGFVDQPQLHFEIRRGTDAMNPLQYL